MTTDITKLADKWREDSRFTGHSGEDCARELEAALPVWTRITDDRDSRPEDAEKVLIEGFGFCKWDDDKHYRIHDNDFWRYECDIDYPPEDMK